jgi:hypothetical protein
MREDKLKLRIDTPLETRGSCVWVFMSLLALIQHKDTPFDRNKPDSFMSEDLGNLGLGNKVVVEDVVVSNEPNCPQGNTSKCVQTWFGELSGRILHIVQLKGQFFQSFQRCLISWIVFRVLGH